MCAHVVLGGAAEPAGFAFEALPPVALHGGDHVGCELETGEVGTAGTVGAAQEGLGSVTALLVRHLVAQTEVAGPRRLLLVRHLASNTDDAAQLRLGSHWLEN